VSSELKPVTLDTDWPRVGGVPAASGVIRSQVADFEVEERLGFEPEGDGEHAFLFIQKRELNSVDVERELARLSGVPRRDIGYCGLKDRRALTRQWFSVGLAGREEPDWSSLERENLQILVQTRHRRKLRRGVHRGNAFRLVVRELEGDRDALELALRQVQRSGVPNYFGEQRFGRGGGNSEAAMAWVRGESKAPKRQQRGIYLSTLRALVFNTLLAARVEAGDWNALLAGDVCLLAGTGSLFAPEAIDADLEERIRQCDLHPGLPLWGSGEPHCSAARWKTFGEQVKDQQQVLEFLEARGLALGWRPTRVLPDDFCWQFCEDGALVLEFSLGAGSYATAVLRELITYNDNTGWSETSSE
jgi:tRNA pseudouridine13 synthase